MFTIIVHTMELSTPETLGAKIQEILQVNGERSEFRIIVPERKSYMITTGDTSVDEEI
jgi:hypothetical protein